MKKTKLQRIIALLLASLLLMGAMTSLVAFADEVVDETPEGEEETPAPEATVSIAYKNVAYEAATKLVYYVESANLPEGASLKLIIFDEEPTEIVIDEETVLRSAFGKLAVSGVEYDAFASDEIDYPNLRKSLYAVAVALDAENNIVAQSDVLAYSVFDYCMDRFEKDPTDDQKNLYKTLLDFGAAVQAINYNDDNIDEVGGWANAYYGVKVENLDGENVISTTKYYYTPKDIGKQSTITADKFSPKGNGFAYFDSAAFSNPMLRGTVSGYDITYTVLAELGFNTVSCKYDGQVAYAADFAIGKKPVFDGMNFCGNPAAAYPAADADGDGIKDGRYFIAEEEDGNTYLRYYDNNDSGSTNWSFTKELEEGKTEYLIEFAFRWQGSKNYRGDGSHDVIYNNGVGNKVDNSGKRVGNLGMFTSSSDGKSLSMHGKSLQFNEWYTISYHFVANETDGDFDIYVSINGEKVLTTDGPGIGFIWEPRYGSNGHNDIIFDVDNLCFYGK